MYVLLWAGLKYLRSKKKLSPAEDNLFTQLQAHDPAVLSGVRTALFEWLETAFDGQPELHLSPAFRPLAQLVYRWHKLLQRKVNKEARKDVIAYYEQARAKELITQHEGLRACYIKFLNMPYQVNWAGDEHLSPELEQEWRHGSLLPQP
jgi:hypothetical protein